MKLQCPTCNEIFSASKNQISLVEKVDGGQMAFAIIECPECFQTFQYRLKREETSDVKKLSYRCPVKACLGYVAEIGDVTDFEYGCGECGTVWKDRDDLFAAIKEAVKKHSYRKGVYIFREGDVIPASPEDEPKNYQKLVLKELES